MGLAGERREEEGAGGKATNSLSAFLPPSLTPLLAPPLAPPLTPLLTPLPTPPLGQDMSDLDSPSYRNPVEADAVVAVVQRMLDSSDVKINTGEGQRRLRSIASPPPSPAPPRPRVPPPPHHHPPPPLTPPAPSSGEIGVIAAFRSQVLLIRKRLRARDLGNVNVGQVHDYQGQEVGG